MRRPHAGSCPLVAAVGTHVVALWPAGRRNSDVGAVANKLRDAVHRADNRGTLSVAVSQPCSSLQGYPGAFRLGRGALELIRLKGTCRRNSDAH
ncbi:hypothetical protein ACFVTM_18020 [Arthrobacter sp. NPDC058130]|uniref:hypothetical protein n=1 Tax=Arthrobacter sp. NPDC058130 TaxID=3346353 RepID=UPI0036E107DB